MGDQRVGVGAETLEPIQGQTRLLEEGGQDAEGLAQLIVALRRRREDRRRVLDQPAELALALRERAEDDPGVLDEARDGLILGVEHAQQAVRVLGEGLQVRDRGREVGSPPRRRERRALHPDPERVAGPLVEGAEDLIELHGFGDLGPRQGAALRHGRGVRVALSQLHVRLPEQRLLAQDRPRVLGHGRVAVVDLDRRQREVPVLALVLELDLLHLAHGDVRDPDVRFDGELGGLIHRDLDPVALRGERDRPPEGVPEEEQQTEAGERERDRDRDLAGGWCALAHQTHPGMSVERGWLVSSSSVRMKGVLSPIPSPNFATPQESITMPRRSGPCAS